MPLTSTADLVEAARARGGAVGAFNVITLEHIEGVVHGAEQAASPVVLQISENAVIFHGGALRPLARAAVAAGEQSSVQVALHLDHVTDMDLLRQASEAGFSSAMFDAGAAPYEENVRATRDAVEWAHRHGLWLEAELGYVGGKADAPASAHAPGVRTDPAQARTFVHETGVDALAVAVGSSHAMITRDASLDHGLIRRIADAVPVPLVLHGSSGVADEDLRRAVIAGMRKINVGTALNIAYTRSVRQALAANDSIVDPRKYLDGAREAVATIVAATLAVLAGDRRAMKEHA